jgi:iodotyrosine deiodinase
MQTKLINNFPHIPYVANKYTTEQMLQYATAFYTSMNQRRSIRYFSPEPVAEAVIEQIVKAAGTSPSGAHKQPWHFCVVSNAELKTQIRQAAEAEEKESYARRMNDEWLADLAPIGTDWQKPFLEIAPYLIVVFKKTYNVDADGQKQQNYYVQESVGIACGLLLAAIKQAGLASLTHTPSPMNFLSKVLGRPENEKPFLLVPVGHAAADCYVPQFTRNTLEQISTWYT